VMALEISVVMAFGFVLGRVWPLHDQRPVLMADYEVDAGDFTPAPTGRIPTSCAATTGQRLYYPRPLNGGSSEVVIATVSKATAGAAPSPRPRQVASRCAGVRQA